MNTYEEITKENNLINSLIKNGRDNFDIHVAIQLRDLVDQIKKKRGVGTRGARKIASELLRGGNK